MQGYSVCTACSVRLLLCGDGGVALLVRLGGVDGVGRGVGARAGAAGLAGVGGAATYVLQLCVGDGGVMDGWLLGGNWVIGITCG